jgi:M6 family metalloprotease-like protein
MSVNLVMSMLTVLILISVSSAGTVLAQGPLETQEGILRAYVVDDPNFQNSVIHYFLQEADGSQVDLDFLGNLDVKPGSRVKVTGFRTSANALEVDPNLGVGSLEITAEPSLASSSLGIGIKKAAAIFINYSDVSSTVPPIPDTLSIFNGPVKNFYVESSYSKFSISADAYGRYNINKIHTCEPIKIAEDAIQVADPQVNFNNYQFIVVINPSDLCETKQGIGSIGPVSFETAEGTKELGVSWQTNHNWDNGVNYFTLGIAHELGHNLGAYHANGWDCGNKIISEACLSPGYADGWDEMGGAFDYLVHFGGYHKEIYGWFNSGNIVTVTASGKYNISPVELSTNAPVILKVPRGNGEYYYVETRSKIGFDAPLPDNAVNGALIKISPTVINGGDSHLIDATPNSNTQDEYLDFQNAGFVLNKVFKDDYRGIKITPLSKNNGVLTVDVTFFAPTLKTPTKGSTVTTLRPALDWTDIPARTTYTIQVSKTNIFTNFTVNKDVTASTFTPAFDLARATTYYWRVRANYSFGPSNWSTVFSFRVQ